MKKRFFQLVLTAVLSVSCVATGVNVSAAPLSSEGYSIEKVSHPERGAGETDGILSFDAMGEESNRNQSYVWSRYSCCHLFSVRLIPLSLHGIVVCSVFLELPVSHLSD